MPRVRVPKAVERWLDEGSSPLRIGYGLVSFVALVVAFVGYVAHPHHPGAVWWLLAAVAVIAVWALLEMVRWHVLHNRLQRRLAEYEPARNTPLPMAEPEPRALRPVYRQREPYRQPDEIGIAVEHRLGIRNPSGNSPVTGVRLEWTEMAPRPTTEGGYPPVVPPQPVPRLEGGDPGIGITLPPGHEEFWVIATTTTSSDGSMRVGMFSQGSMAGRFRGMLWRFDPGKRWRLTYRIVADKQAPVEFSVVMTAVDGQVRCDVES